MWTWVWITLWTMLSLHVKRCLVPQLDRGVRARTSALFRANTLPGGLPIQLLRELVPRRRRARAWNGDPRSLDVVSLPVPWRSTQRGSLGAWELGSPGTRGLGPAVLDRTRSASRAELASDLVLRKGSRASVHEPPSPCHHGVLSNTGRDGKVAEDEVLVRA